VQPVLSVLCSAESRRQAAAAGTARTMNMFSNVRDFNMNARSAVVLRGSRGDAAVCGTLRPFTNQLSMSPPPPPSAFGGAARARLQECVLQAVAQELEGEGPSGGAGPLAADSDVGLADMLAVAPELAVAGPHGGRTRRRAG